MGCVFYRNGIDLAKYGAFQRAQLALKLGGVFDLSALKRAVSLAHFARAYVRHNGDHSSAAERGNWQSLVVVARINGQLRTSGNYVCNSRKIAASLLQSADISTLREPFQHVYGDADARSCRNVISYDRL